MVSKSTAIAEVLSRFDDKIRIAFSVIVTDLNQYSCKTWVAVRGCVCLQRDCRVVQANYS